MGGKVVESRNYIQSKECSYYKPTNTNNTKRLTQFCTGSPNTQSHWQHSHYNCHTAHQDRFQLCGTSFYQRIFSYLPFFTQLLSVVQQQNSGVYHNSQQHYNSHHGDKVQGSIGDIQ